jgi:hypothetical protein
MARKLRSTAATLLLTGCSTDYHDGRGPVWGRSLAPPAGGPSVLCRAQQHGRPAHQRRPDQHEQRPDQHQQQRQQSRNPARPHPAVPRAGGRVNTENTTGGKRQAGEQHSRVTNTISGLQAQETSLGADRGPQTPHEPSSVLTNDGIEHYASGNASRTGNHAYNARNADDQIVFPIPQGEPIDGYELEGVRDHTSFDSDDDSLDGDSDSSDSEDDNTDNNTFVAHDNAARAVTRQQAGGVDLTQWGGDPAAAIWDLHRLGVM